jgi:quinol monooxygenase YgiN
MSTPYAFEARIEAKPEKADDVAALLTGALPLAQAEPGTVAWYAALMANADELLAAPPEILPADVLAAK